MISGTFKAGVQTLKPGDLVRERSLATGFVGDYVVLNAKIFPMTGNTVYTLYTIGTHPLNTPIPGISEIVGTTLTLSRGQMINDFTETWSKLC